MANYWLYQGLDEEKRKLSVNNAVLRRSLAYQKQKREEAEQIGRDWKQKYEEQEKEISKLQDELEKVKKERDTYRDMVFKATRKKEAQEEQQQGIFQSEPKRTVGGQTGHKGYGRVLPNRVDKHVRVFAPVCPHCKGMLKRVQATVSHTVEDIPAPQMQHTIVTRYEVERQWCRNCHKEVTVTPSGVIPKSRLGVNLLVQILFWKYVCRIPLNIIVTLLETTYAMQVSEGTLVLCLRRASQYFGKSYQQILKEVRAAPVKHADETGWRVNGQNNWCWAFLTHHAVYYTIEETRGKGIPEKLLKNCHSEDVLVRDDYAGYTKLPFIHQSCWAHLLRESHKAATYTEASEEMKQLHKRVKEIYHLLEQTVNEPFVKKARDKTYAVLLEQIQTIIQTPYQKKDAQRVHHRITAQNKNLLTALRYEHVPLTNNLAERMIRPLVVTRKISGSSRSKKGATIHAINMSIMQTMKLKQQPIIPTLQRLILNALGNN